MKQRVEVIIRYLPVILFVLILIFSGFTAYHYAYHITDSDAASELVLCNLLADQNKIVTTDWLYSTELRVFNTNLIYMPLFKIFDDWHVVRFLSIVIFQIFLLFSYFYLSRRMKISLRAYFLSASLLMLPSGVVYGRMILYHSHYAPCIVYGFLIVGLYLSFMEHMGSNRLHQILRIAALLLLSMMSCLNGFRQFPSTMIPLLMSALVVALRDHGSAPKTLADISKRDWAGIGTAGIVFAVGAVGLLINAWILPRYFLFRQMDNTLIILPTVKNFRNLLVGYLSLFGFQEGRMLFSLEGLLALLSVPAALILLVVSLSELVTRHKSIPYQIAFSEIMYPVTMLCMTVVFLLTNSFDNYPQYYLTAFVWIFPYLGLQADRLLNSMNRFTLKQTLVVLACVCLLCNGIYNNLFYLNPDDKQVKYDPTIEVDEWDRFAGVIQFVQENDLEVGYATFWNANILTEVSNGQIPMISLIREYFPNNYVYHYALASKQSFEFSYVEDKNVFLLLTYPESFIFCETDLAQYSIPVYEDKYYRIYMFDFTSDVWEFFLEKAKFYDQQAVLAQLLPQME